MNDYIIYGGAFNPPTIGHYKIIEYLLNKFDNKLIILPTNNYYKSNEIVSFEHRKEMINLMLEKYSDRIIVSDYEQTLDKYYGTYYTLKHFEHPLFVIGADSLDTIHQWINYPNVVKENKFIVFPRDGVNIEESKVYKKYKKHFIICDDFIENDISSTNFRKNKDKSLVTEEVYLYICNNKLYL